MQEIQPGFGFGYWHIFLPVQRKLKQKMTHQNLTGDSKLAAQSAPSVETWTPCYYILCLFYFLATKHHRIWV